MTTATPASIESGMSINIDQMVGARKTRLVNASAEIFSRLVNPVFFLQATRESGYKGTSQALAELVDNAIQAKATGIHIYLEAGETDPNDITVYIYDNGTGMDQDTIALAPQFGGSSRFNDRSGIGRFGMGLPNSSVSQCTRFEVYSKRRGGETFFAYLDLEEVEKGQVSDEGFLAPVPVRDIPLPLSLTPYRAEHGTLVVWRNCDRLDPKNIDALKKKLIGFMGQSFRNFIYVDTDEEGNKVPPARTITVNGTPVNAFDPLFLDPRAEYSGADDRGTYYYDLPVPEQPGKTSRVTVKFSILPVEIWGRYSNKEKNAMRVVGRNASKGFCIMRAGREVDVTDRFFLIGRKDANGDEHEGRIINNDAWWRCEISFSPELDKLFGVTHTKQDIHPTVQAMQKMREEITGTAMTLRNEYDERRLKKTPKKTLPSEETATRNDQFLPPPPEMPQDPKDIEDGVKEYGKNYSREDETADQAEDRVKSKLFTIELEAAKEGPFYRTTQLGPNTIVYLNTDHPFYTELYAVLDDNEAQNSVQLLLFALARGERQAGMDGKMWYLTQRSVWSQALRAYLTK